MAFTVDYSTDLGKVRALINDVDAANPGMEDAQIQAYLDLNDDDVTLAAVSAMLATATRFSRMKKVKIMDLEVDGSIAARDLRAIAAQMRDDYLNDPDFDIAKQLNTVFAVRQDVVNELKQQFPSDIIFTEDLI